MTARRRSSHRQIVNGLLCGYQFALKLYALGWSVGDPIPEELHEDLRLSQLGYKHEVMPRTITMWISLGWNPESPMGMIDPETGKPLLTSTNPTLRKERTKVWNDRRAERERIAKAEKQAIAEADRELKARRAGAAKVEPEPIRTTAAIDDAITRAKLNVAERLAARLEASEAIRQAKIDAFVAELERRARDRERLLVEQRKHARARHAAEVEALARSAARLAEIEETARAAPPPMVSEEEHLAAWSTIDRGVREVLSRAPMPLSAFTVGRRLNRRPAEVVDALERMEARGELERGKNGPNGATYRIKQ